MHTGFRRVLLAALAAIVLLPALASAAPITYIYRGFATGSLAGNAFQASPFVITAEADTDDIGPWCCSNAQNTHASADIEIQGLNGGNSFAFTVPTHTWIAEGCCMGFGANLSVNFLTLTNAPSLLNVGYGLDTAIGPVPATADTQGQFLNVATTLGGLTITAVDRGTFEARVPEPSTFALLGSALAGAALLRRRRG